MQGPQKTPMIRYKKIRTYCDMFSGKIKKEVSYGEMPESFFSCLRYEGDVRFEVVTCTKLACLNYARGPDDPDPSAYKS